MHHADGDVTRMLLDDANPQPPYPGAAKRALGLRADGGGGDRRGR